ncbi:MAG: ShlB/FhaC/HecB family hemolysin secretion/activation protein [Guyparkeria sp.]|uniref:ShlB/FhaC/HecB family hemolysin secretion/activation protein n=1 Tax=Guyparkeria sp. TaxID=2035736 RepID=UPI00397873A0
MNRIDCIAPAARQVIAPPGAADRMVKGWLLASLILALTLSTASAQVVPQMVDERHPALSKEQQEEREDAGRDTGSTVTLPKGVEGSDDGSSIEVSSVRFQGGSVFALEELAEDFEPMIGKNVSAERISEAIDRITRQYQDAGYPLSYAYLAQEGLDQGVLTVVLVEGYVARTEIEVSDGPVKKRVEALAERIIDERPLTRETFERYTALMSRIPGVQVKVNAPVPRTPNGATTLRVVEQSVRRIEPALSMSGDEIDDYQMLGSVALQANTPYAEKLSVASLVPIDDDDSFYSVEYEQSVGTDGWRLDGSASRYETEEVGTLPIAGGIRLDQAKTATRYRLGGDFPISLFHRHQWTVDGHLDQVKERTRTDIGDSLRLEQDLAYSAIELGTGVKRSFDSRLLDLRLEVRQGVDLGNNRQDAHLENGSSRRDLEPAEDLQFTRFALQGLWREIIGESFQVDVRTEGFWSNDALPAPERGNYGGTRFGRAYSSGQAEGDYGVAGEIVLRYKHSLDNGWVRQVEPYVALDGARTRFNDRDIENDLASAAAGVAIARGRTYRLSVEYAVPVGDRDIETDSRDGRVNATFRWSLGG